MSEKRKWALRLLGIGTFLVLWEVMGRLMGEALFAPVSSMVAVYPSLIEENNILVEQGFSHQSPDPCPKPCWPLPRRWERGSGS